MVYWKCVAVFFEYSVRHNPTARHILFSNQSEEQLPAQDGFDWSKHLKQLGVELVTLPLTWQTPPGYFGSWRNQFYIFDILQFFEKQVYDDDTPLLVFDSDCIINRPLGGLFDALKKQGLLTLPIRHRIEDNINGITRKDMRTLFAGLNGTDPGDEPVYYGGEVFAATPPVVRQINARMPGIWEAMLQRHREGKTKFNEEAHFLSFCYAQIGKFGSIEPFMRRIWTSTRYNDVEVSDVELPIWHLPSEKTGGIAILFRWLKNNQSLPTDPIALGGILGIPKRTRYLDWKHLLKYTPLYRLWLKLSGT
ncbi:MAG: hypothetical protein IPM98_09360 [Lewinellaceae bacterium]|nr:hypothetical protein [Lewinellaceae bacterium]